MSGNDHDEDDGEKTVIRTPDAAPVEPDGDDRTVIQPGPAVPDDDDDDQRTVIAPASDVSDEVDRTIIAPAAATAPGPPPPPPKPPAKPISGITNGQVLNHTYEVKRFIARGGMGEVFEGVNVTNGQRVAIKVILPALASDPAVIEMFVKEATVLERLVHPALVNYRTQARDPEAGVFYIVTNYIEGTSLEKVIGMIEPSLEEIVGLARRLAEGLGMAHSLGAIHRDIAPDNILLENDDLARAQIIDFGIARDIDPGSKTVIGTGFAGKYSFVAPEQLGAFKSDVGAWSDVYSLGLVLLGLARGKTLKLGTSPVEANDLRKDGIDTSDAPRALRPLLDAMLVYDPAHRLRSMDDVLAMLDTVDVTNVEETEPEIDGSAGETDGIGAGTQSQIDEDRQDDNSIAGLPKPVVFAGGGVLALALLGGLGAIAFGGGGDTSDTDGGADSGGVASESIDAATALQRAQAALETTNCHWLDLEVTGQPGNLQLKASGVAGNPGSIEPAVFSALQSAGVSTDFTDISQITDANCAAIDAMRPFRATGAPAITQPQTRSELQRFASDHEFEQLRGRVAARHSIDINLPDSTQIAIVSLSGGEMGSWGEDTVLGMFGEQARQGAGKFRENIASEGEEPSWTSVILLEGGGQLGAAANALASGDYDTFAQLAEANDINVHMVWHELVNDIPD